MRENITHQLTHFTDFDLKYRLSNPSNSLVIENIVRELKKRHSPNFVFAISEDPALDEKELRFVAALQQIVGRGVETVLSCIPGRLAFVETEDERFILNAMTHWKGVNMSALLSAAKMRTAKLSRESFRQQRWLWSGTTSPVPMPRN